MEITAQLNNLRIAPRKVRAVTARLRGLDARRAKSQLAYTVRRSAPPLAKLLDSALANASRNFGLVQDNLYIKQVIVNEGTKLKRFRPKGFGMTAPLEKKTSHIKIILAERVPGLKAIAKPKPVTAEPPLAREEKIKVEKKPTYQVPEKEIKKSGMFGGLKRKFFRRKTI